MRWWGKPRERNAGPGALPLADSGQDWPARSHGTLPAQPGIPRDLNDPFDDHKRGNCPIHAGHGDELWHDDCQHRSCVTNPTGGTASVMAAKNK